MTTGFISSTSIARFSLPSALLAILSMTLVFSTQLQAHEHGKQAVKSVHITNARINPTVPGMQVTGVYLELHNPNKTDITLIGANSTISDRIELHEHTMSDGLMRMQKINNGITVPAESKATLAPGGYHIMIMNLKKVINEGEQYTLTLDFSDGSQQTINTTAKKPSHHSAPHKHHKH